jgi:hypothetical protein
VVPWPLGFPVRRSLGLRSFSVAVRWYLSFLLPRLMRCLSSHLGIYGLTSY